MRGKKVVASDGGPPCFVKLGSTDLLLPHRKGTGNEERRQDKPFHYEMGLRSSDIESWRQHPTRIETLRLVEAASFVGITRFQK
jgi:hypothetical protein